MNNGQSFVARILLVSILVLTAHFGRTQQTGKWGDQGNGTYRNPVLAADYSDPDVIRVDRDYYLISSTMQLAPGMVVLHSLDLVNWQTIGYVVRDLTVLGPELNWDRMNRYNQGMYAGAIRYHDGKFWVYFTSFLEGLFVATATNPAGPWDVRPLLDQAGKPLRVEKWDDPCPFWDDDGRAYLVASKPGGAWYPHLFQLNAAGTQLLDADSLAMSKPGPEPSGQGTVIYGVRTSEGNKIYKRNGYYYHFHNQVVGNVRVPLMKRSRHLYGTQPNGAPGTPAAPGTYEVKQLLFGSAENREPNQGGLVDTPDGKWYFLTQTGRGGFADGRNLHLLPVQWLDDWPMPGRLRPDGLGELQWSLEKPVPGSPVTCPQGSDEFNAPTLKPDWQWNYQPRADKWSLTEHAGHLRLHAFKPLVPGRFFKAGNTLGQRYFASDTLTATVKLDIRHLVDGQEAGFAHFNGGKNYSTLGVVQRQGIRKLKYEEDGPATSGVVLPPNVKTFWLRSSVSRQQVNTYAYSLDGKKFIDFGGHYRLKWGNYRGDYLGVYTFNTEQEAGYVDVDWFHYTIVNK